MAVNMALKSRKIANNGWCNVMRKIGVDLSSATSKASGSKAAKGTTTTGKVDAEKDTTKSAFVASTSAAKASFDEDGNNSASGLASSDAPGPAADYPIATNPMGPHSGSASPLTGGGSTGFTPVNDADSTLVANDDLAANFADADEADNDEESATPSTTTPVKRSHAVSLTQTEEEETPTKRVRRSKEEIAAAKAAKAANAEIRKAASEARKAASETRKAALETRKAEKEANKLAKTKVKAATDSTAATPVLKSNASADHPFVPKIRPGVSGLKSTAASALSSGPALQSASDTTKPESSKNKSSGAGRGDDVKVVIEYSPRGQDSDTEV